MAITNARARKYMDAVNGELARGEDYLVAIWNSGHTFRAHEDKPEEIAAAIGRSPAFVFDRMRLAKDYTKAQLVALVRQYEITTKTELWAVAYGSPRSSERVRRGLYLPPSLYLEADNIGLDLVSELKAYFETVRLSELRAMLTVFFAEHEALV